MCLPSRLRLSLPSSLDKERYILLWDKQAILYVAYGMVFSGPNQNVIVLA